MERVEDACGKYSVLKRGFLGVSRLPVGLLAPYIPLVKGYFHPPLFLSHDGVDQAAEVS